MNTLISFLVNPSSYLSLFSIAFGVFQYVQKKKAEKALKSITWKDMQNASEKIARKLIKTYQPAVIYIPNIKSGIMLQFIRNYFKEYIPVIVGQAVSKEYFAENDCTKIKGLGNYSSRCFSRAHNYCLHCNNRSCHCRSHGAPVLL